MKTLYRDKVALAHAQDVVSKYQKIFYKRPLTEQERQEMFYWESKVKEEYAKPARPFGIDCNGNCNPPFESYDMNCPLHGWGTDLASQ